MSDEQEILEDQNEFQDALQNDGDAIDAYIQNIYIKSVPAPEPPSGEELSFWKIAGLESSIFVLSAIGAAILSAIRTGGIFLLLEEMLIKKFNMNESIGNVFGFLSMVSALLAFEGYILGTGLTVGKRSGKMEISKAGMFISLVTVIAAGIFSSFSIVDVSEGFQLFMNIVLALITGGASAAIALYSAENFGFILNHVTSTKNRLLKEYQDAYMEWHEEAVGAYMKSNYNIRHKRSEKIYGSKQTSQPNQTNAPQQSHSEKRPGEQVKEFIASFIASNRRWPQLKDIQQAIPVGTSTAFYSSIEFVVANQIALLENGILDAQKIEDAIQSLAKKNKVDPQTYRQ